MQGLQMITYKEDDLWYMRNPSVTVLS